MTSDYAEEFNNPTHACDDFWCVCPACGKPMTWKPGWAGPKSPDFGHKCPDPDCKYAAGRPTFTLHQIDEDSVKRLQRKEDLTARESYYLRTTEEKVTERKIEALKKVLLDVPAMHELLAERVRQRSTPLACGCHCTGWCNGANPCMHPCPAHGCA